MSVLSNNEKLENYLDELADEYKKLLYKDLISRTKSIDDYYV